MKTRNIGTLVTAAAVILGLAISPSAAAGQTPWFDRDDPSGVGDFETIQDLLKIQCRIKGTTTAVTTGSPAGYNCSLPIGGWCTNAQTNPKNSCRDIEIQLSW